MFNPSIKSKIADSIRCAVEREVNNIACNIGDYIDINDYIDSDEIGSNIAEFYSDDIGTIVSEIIEDAIMDL